MNKRQLTLFSLITGRLYCPIVWMHELLSEYEGRPVFTHELFDIKDKHHNKLFEEFISDLNENEKKEFLEFWNKNKKNEVE